MGLFIANKVVKMLIQNSLIVKESKILLLGITFKENCPDIRNSKVIDIYTELIQFGLNVDVYDPHADKKEDFSKYGIIMTDKLNVYDGIILAVSHLEFLELDYKSLKKQKKSIIFDIKSVLDRNIVTARL